MGHRGLIDCYKATYALTTCHDVVRSWHFSTNLEGPHFGRYLGNSGHPANEPKTTDIGHTLFIGLKRAARSVAA